METRVFFEDLANKGLRVMFLGNSMTYREAAPEMGWYNSWGMAASAKEKDYVHLCISRIKEHHPDAAFCICQGCEWEVYHKHGFEGYAIYEQARKFEADIIVMRLVENCSKEEYEKKDFLEELGRLLEYLNPNNKAVVIMTTGFWKHPADEAIRVYAEENNLPLCELGDLEDLDEMKALGLFEDDGVASHPGDLGMEKMADRICDIMFKLDEFKG